MAQGLALIAFYAFLVVYLMVLLPALVLFRNGTDSPRLVATLNVLLLAPAVVGLAALAFDLVVELDRRRSQRASYEHFASTATTTEHRSPGGTFSFRYASSPDGLLPDDDPNDVCVHAYATLLDRESWGFKSLFVIVPEDTRDIALEVVLELGTRIITGPVEDNAPGGERVEWYDTIRLEP